MRFPCVLLAAASLAWGEPPTVWTGAEIDARLVKTGGLLHSGPGYSIRLAVIGKLQQSAGSPRDQMLWVRRGTGRISIESRSSEIAPGDLVRVPRRTRYAIEPAAGGLAVVAVEIQPLAAGRSAPAGIRPAQGSMGDVAKKAEIDATIAKTEANAPLHSQDNFTANFVLFKGRVGPWESHAGCADIYLVQTGAGVIQLGGRIENAKEDSPGEPRGTAMTGSRESEVGAGSMVVIPRNVAHHMNPKTLPLAYVLIKVWGE